MPPMMQATNPLIPSCSPKSYCVSAIGAMMIPAIAPSVPLIMKLMPLMVATRTPTSRAANGFIAQARNILPR